MSLNPQSSPDLNQQILQDLNPPQREAVSYGSGPLLVFAGAGSGKTRVITRRIAWLVAQGLHPAEILALTFTNKAANEMKERLVGLLGPVARHMWVGTFHSLLLRILRPNAELLGFTNSFTILDTDEQKTLLKQVLKDLRIDEHYLAPADAHRQISHAKNHMLGPQDYEAQEAKGFRQHQAYYQDIARVYQAYQKALKDQNSMDFDDILLYAVQLFRQNPEVLAAYSGRFRHILVDEYQDTNKVQYEVLRLLASAHGNLCVVGDDDQSIYSFRGAQQENILNFEKDFPQAHIVKLEQNYRSTPIILQAANAVIANNEKRVEKKLWTSSRGGEAIQFYRAADHYTEARWIAQEIKRLGQRAEDPISPAQIGILYRLNALSRNLEFALREEGIPYKIYGGLRFYDRKEIRDVLAYLRLIDSPDDRLAFERVINTPKRSLGQVTVDRVLNYATEEGVSPLEVAAQADQYPDLSHAAVRLQEFAALIERMRAVAQANQLSFPDFIKYVEEESGLYGFWQAEQQKLNLEAESRLQNLEELRSDALEFANRQAADLAVIAELSDRYGEGELTQALLDDQGGLTHQDLSLPVLTRSFLENAALFAAGDEEDPAETVSLMTIHSAKGLEFDACFIVGVEQGIFPNVNKLLSPEDEEEERRLFYVAITRARKRLAITTAQSRLLYGKTAYYPPSQFLKEIPDHLIEESGGSRYGDGEFLSYQTSSGGSAYGGGYKGRTSYAWENQYSSAPQSGPVTRGKPVLKSQTKANPFASKPKSSGLHTNSPSAQNKLCQLEPGAKVRHKRFGEGTLIKKETTSTDAILSIDFGGKTKHMMASMADLDILD